MVKIEDIAFWILMTLIIGVAIWKLFGSPTDTAALISITLFIAGSETLLWRALFSSEKKTAIGFIKTKHEIQDMKQEINIKLNNIEDILSKKMRK